jgi:hypothetical protein
MTPTTHSRSVAIARPSLLKSGRPLTIKGRLCQRYARGYHTNPIDAFFYTKSPDKMKYDLYTTAKHACVMVNRSLLT